MELFAEKWDALYPSISKSWPAHWTRVIPLFAFPGDIRKVIYTTNVIESVNMTLRKVTRNHRIFPSDEAVYKVVSLAMCNIAKKWTMPIHHWEPALNRLAVKFAERFPMTKNYFHKPLDRLWSFPTSPRNPAQDPVSSFNILCIDTSSCSTSRSGYLLNIRKRCSF